MRQRAICILTVLLTVFAIDGLAVAGPFEDGKAAHERGDYQAAFDLWLPLAEQGHVEAQTWIGLLYGTGGGRPKDVVAAHAWYLRAANQGDANAQVLVGADFQVGRAVPKDMVQAYMWFTLSAARGDEVAKFLLGIASQMTLDQVAEAQRLAGAWQAKPERP